MSIACTDHFTLDWLPLEPADPQRLAALAAGNAATLATLLALEATQTSEESVPAGVAERLHRLEVRLDAALLLLADLAAARLSAPAPRRVTLTHDTLAWDDATPPAAGMDVLVSLFLSARFPRALHLPAHVEQVTGGHVVARRHPHDESFEDAWSRLLFALHRRAIAHARGR